ncbi:MAG: hypothetical protein AAF438_05750 [Pseudomonadota bacterium]
MQRWWFGLLGFLLGLAFTFFVGVKANVEGQLNALSSSMAHSMEYYQSIEAGDPGHVLGVIRDNFNVDYCAADYLRRIPGISNKHKELLERANVFRATILGHSRDQPSTQNELDCQLGY